MIIIFIIFYRLKNNHEEYYIGYLWDCLKNCKPEKKTKCLDFLFFKKEFFVFWDQNIYTKKHFKSKMNNMIKLNYDEFLLKKNDFLEDIYIFDDSFTWTVIFTHEFYSSGKDYFICDKNN